MNAIVKTILAASLLMTGCASYVTPGRGADMEVFAPASKGAASDPIAEAFRRQPSAHFPTALAIARVQAPGYSSPTAQSYGQGRYSIVTMRDIEKPQQFESIATWPSVAGAAPLNRLLIDGKLYSDEPLRQAAASLHADILLIYTIDTTFKTEDKAAPLSVISLGLSPNQQVRLTSTASAVFLDTRSGFVYGLAEATAQQNKWTNAWQNDSATDEARRATESEAFEKLISELKNTWAGVVRTYAK